jgi:hypothetical protein
MAAQTGGFAVAGDDRRLVERYGHGNRSERLRDLQTRAHAQVGRSYTADEVNDLVRQVLEARG